MEFFHVKSNIIRLLDVPSEMTRHYFYLFILHIYYKEKEKSESVKVLPTTGQRTVERFFSNTTR